MEQKYIGITPYDEDGSFEFAGRNDETWALYDRIVRNDYTVYYAASGEGKSSLIRAGLLPILRRRDYFPVYIVFEDKELCNISSIKDIIGNRVNIESVKHNVSYEQSAWSKSRFSIEQSEILKNNLWWKLRNYSFKRGDVELRPLFIFDQFEEVFTKANYEWTDHFFEWLEEISTDYVPESLRERINLWGIEIPTQKNFKALFSFRTEYLGDLDYWCVQKHFLPSLQENRMCLKPLTPKGAREVIGLNESLLGVYGDKIIHGCAETNNVGNNNQPCVYALILSVVCQTLSEIPDKERVALLDYLNNNQDNTIDDVLLRFYKKKLKAVGLDYIKDEKIIADIEDALVDEKGKRSRRDTDEASMQPLLKWIEPLSDKKNGLIKIIGKKEIEGTVINTVEFPHDRLCKAIDSSRKERQGKIAWKLNRQNEWMQFGIISAIFAIIYFLWKFLMPAIKSVVLCVLTSFIETINDEPVKISGIRKVLYVFWDNYLHGKPSTLNSYSLDEGFSTLALMSLLAFFIPLLTISIVRKNGKWPLISFVISLLSTVSFGLLLYRTDSIQFTNNYVLVCTCIGLLVSTVLCVVSILRLKSQTRKVHLQDHNIHKHSFWPLWGGYFIFASCIFYECLFRTTFGANEPCDSAWAIIVLPLLAFMFTWSFFNMKFTNNNKTHKICIGFVLACIILLMILFSYGYIPSYNCYKQSYGMIVSIISILLYFTFLIFIYWHTDSNSKYYILSRTKRVAAILLGYIVLFTTFLLNLGYNPFVISQNSICHVASWRDILIYDIDSLGSKKLGIVYSTNGKVIVPCCIPISESTDSLLKIGEYPFKNGRVPIEIKTISSPFAENKILYNSDHSIEWDSISNIVTAYIPVVPTLEEYLHMHNSGDAINRTLKDSINHYAALLFDELRQANINYILTGKPYGTESLGSLNILDSLQHRVLKTEVNKFTITAMDTTITSSGRKIPRPRINILEDQHLIDFYCELSRSFMLCILKDRASQQDMPAMYTLANTYLLTFFTSVPSMNIGLNQETTNITNQGYPTTKTYKIDSDDILNRRIFAYYDLFNALASMDMGWNQNNYAKMLNSIYSNVIAFNEIRTNLLLVLSSNKFENNVKSESASELIERLRLFLKSRDPDYYESIVGKLDSISFSTNKTDADSSLIMIKDEVLNSMLTVMNFRDDGVYNNAFENICKNLVMVSAIRCNDISNDTARFSKYLSEKTLFYNNIKTVERVSQLEISKNEITEALNELILSLRKIK